MAKIRVVIVYDPQWEDNCNKLEAIIEEGRAWRNGDVTIQDIIEVYGDSAVNIYLEE